MVITVEYYFNAISNYKSVTKCTVTNLYLFSQNSNNFFYELDEESSSLAKFPLLIDWMD